jgi:hypothetical protein
MRPVLSLMSHRRWMTFAGFAPAAAVVAAAAVAVVAAAAAAVTDAAAAAVAAGCLSVREP